MLILIPLICLAIVVVVWYVEGLIVMADVKKNYYGLYNPKTFWRDGLWLLWVQLGIGGLIGLIIDLVILAQRYL
jgi:hypothetical protein